MTTRSFTAKIKAFRDLTEQKLEFVVKESAQDVFEIAQTPKAQGGRMPVDTGFLWNDSFVAAVNGMVVSQGKADGYVLAIAGMELGDTVFGGWTAKYAKFVEYGTSRMAGSFFALNAAQQWQAIVTRNAAKARALGDFPWLLT